MLRAAPAFRPRARADDRMTDETQARAHTYVNHGSPGHAPSMRGTDTDGSYSSRPTGMPRMRRSTRDRGQTWVVRRAARCAHEGC